MSGTNSVQQQQRNLQAISRLEQMECCQPGIFRIGDYVKIKVSFAIHQANDKKSYRLLPVLRAISLLSAKERLVSELCICNGHHL